MDTVVAAVPMANGDSWPLQTTIYHMMGVATLLFIDDDDAVIIIIISKLARIEHLDVELKSMLDAAAVCSCCRCC
jgi:hypothetical protein